MTKTIITVLLLLMTFSKALSQQAYIKPKANINRDGIEAQEERKEFTNNEIKAGKEDPKGKKQKKRKTGKKTSKESLPTFNDVSYGPDKRNVFDFWQAKSDKPTPVLVFFHGGGFVKGNKSYIWRSLLEDCLASGISVASANYRFVTTDPFPAAMHDGAMAIQFIRTKAKEWNIDPERFAAAGNSAGGNMSVWLATHDDLADKNSKDPFLQQSSRLLCIIGQGAQTTNDPEVILKNIGGSHEVHSSLLAFYGIKSMNEVKNTKTQELVKEASSLCHVTKDDPPLLLYYSSELDEKSLPLPETTKQGHVIHHPMFGKLIKDKYDALGLDCQYGVVGKNMPRMITFLKKHFGIN